MRKVNLISWLDYYNVRIIFKKQRKRNYKKIFASLVESYTIQFMTTSQIFRETLYTKLKKRHREKNTSFLVMFYYKMCIKKDNDLNMMESLTY